MQPPFVVFSMPRSRSAWLSSFLTFGEWQCGHDELRHVRSLDDVRSWLSQPSTGTVETAAAPFWRLLAEFRPDARVVTITRPIPEIIDSFQRAGGECNAAALANTLCRLEVKLWQIAERWPDARTYTFRDLSNEEVCRDIFEHCLPYRHDPQWFARVSAVNIQHSVPAIIRYERAFRPQLILANAQARQISLEVIKWRSHLRRASAASGPSFPG